MMWFLTIVLATLTALSWGNHVRYDGYTLLRAHVDKAQAGAILPLIDQYQVDVWASGLDWVDMMVPPTIKEHLLASCQSKGVKVTPKIRDVQELIERDYQNFQTRKAKDFFTVYHSFTEIQAYLKDLATNDDRVTLNFLGETVEKRPMTQVKISLSGTTGQIKKGVWIDCGIHAREWISPATCLWGINHLLTQYGVEPATTELLEKYDIYMLPVYNADGYEYTQTDRLWRKNRRRNSETECLGVDLNRNYEDHFGVAGTHSDPCSEIYKGPYAASEPETRHVQNEFKKRANDLVAMLSLHSYSQLWLYPWGWTNETTPHGSSLDDFARQGTDGIKSVNGLAYQYGQLYQTIYPASGTTVDYAYAVGIVQSHTLELRDKGEYGFLLPEDQIVPTASEVWTGIIKALITYPGV